MVVFLEITMQFSNQYYLVFTTLVISLLNNICVYIIYQFTCVCTLHPASCTPTHRGTCLSRWTTDATNNSVGSVRGCIHLHSSAWFTIVHYSTLLYTSFYSVYHIALYSASRYCNTPLHCPPFYFSLLCTSVWYSKIYLYKGIGQ